MSKYFMFTDPMGSQMFSTDEKVPDFAVEVPRMPKPFEKWDAETKAFVKDHAGEADYNAGADHIAKMHARKTFESALIIAGYELDSMVVVQEAALRGIEPVELAALVLVKTEAQTEIELARIAAKNQIEIAS